MSKPCSRIVGTFTMEELWESGPAELPDGAGWQYEPKWDGFRVLIFKGPDGVYLQSRDKKPLNRYFPELAAPLAALHAPHLAKLYAVAAIGWGLGRARSRIPLLGIPYVFCLLNWTTVVAFFRFVTRRQTVTWARSVLPTDLPPTDGR